MENKDDAFDKFQDSLSHLEGKFHVLEQSIPMEIQLGYFRFSKKMKGYMPEQQVLQEAYLLFDELCSVDKKKILLVSLASMNTVEAFRLLEKYSKAPDEELKEWSVIALEESRMGMERLFSEEDQIFISTGLGGKGNKLRFFIALFPVSTIGFTEFQQQVVKDELKFSLLKQESEIEELTSHQKFIGVKALFPIKAGVKTMIDAVIEECNQYGNFMQSNFLITNVKILSVDELLKLAEKKNPSA